MNPKRLLLATLLGAAVLAVPALAAGGGTYTYSATLAATGASAPTTASTFASLTNLRGFRITICAESGRTLSGSGTISVYYLDERDGVVSLNPGLQYSVTATTQCQTFPDSEVMVPQGKAYFLPVTVGISGGTNVTIRMEGELK